LLPPSSAHFFGTDSTGLDIFSRTIAAPRVDVLIGVTATVLALTSGVAAGVWAGYFSGAGGFAGKVSELVMRLMDILQSFPVFILALALAAAAGPSVTNVIAVIAFLNFPVFLRLTRSAVLSTRERPYIEAAHCAGNSELRLMFRHVLPNSLGPSLIAASVSVGQAILITAGLSFVGAGVRVPTPEWGSMISIGAPNMITGQWWPALFPGIALGLTVLGFALVGDGLRYYLDPTRRR
jgi:peptide/nickel transport system permease protein